MTATELWLRAQQPSHSHPMEVESRFASLTEAFMSADRRTSCQQHPARTQRANAAHSTHHLNSCIVLIPESHKQQTRPGHSMIYTIRFLYEAHAAQAIRHSMVYALRFLKGSRSTPSLLYQSCPRSHSWVTHAAHPTWSLYRLSFTPTNSQEAYAEVSIQPFHRLLPPIPAKHTQDTQSSTPILHYLPCSGAPMCAVSLAAHALAPPEAAPQAVGYLP
jgi:hypothetical protein